MFSRNFSAQVEPSKIERCWEKKFLQTNFRDDFVASLLKRKYLRKIKIARFGEEEQSEVPVAD